MTQVTGFIEDGYDIKTHVKSVAGIYPDVNLQYRPLLPLEIGRHLDTSKDTNCEEFRDAMAKLVAGQLVSWNIKDRAGKIVKISHENLKKVAPALLTRLYAIVMGQDGGDGAQKPDSEGDAKN